MDRDTGEARKLLDTARGTGRRSGGNYGGPLQGRSRRSQEVCTTLPRNIPEAENPSDRCKDRNRDKAHENGKSQQPGSLSFASPQAHGWRSQKKQGSRVTAEVERTKWRTNYSCCSCPSAGPQKQEQREGQDWAGNGGFWVGWKRDSGWDWLGLLTPTAWQFQHLEES